MKQDPNAKKIVEVISSQSTRRKNTEKKPMAVASLKRWLKQYKVSSRSSTLTNAFMAALAPFTEYDEVKATAAMKALGQSPDELVCVYCGEAATTWDHLVNLVVGKKLNGYGHQLGNLVPCCAKCNSAKGDRSHKQFIHEGTKPQHEKEELTRLLDEHLRLAVQHEFNQGEVELAEKLHALLENVQSLLVQADDLIEAARPVTKKRSNSRKKKSESEVAANPGLSEPVNNG